MKGSEIRSIVRAHFNKPLVAVFIGGTQGIGHYTVNVLAQVCASNKVPLKAYIVGRGAEKAKAVIAECSTSYPEGQFSFIQAKDLTSIMDVDRVSNEIMAFERSKHATDARIDLMVLTQGQVLLGPRQETAEGLDKSMALLYYSRIRFIMNFMPLLEAANQPHIVSVYAAGMESTLYKDDLSLRSPDHYSFANCRSHCVHMKTMAFERIAKDHPKLGLAHIYPGLVFGPGFDDPTFPAWLKIFLCLLKPFAPLLSTSPEDAGYIMLLPATDVCPARGDGSNRDKTTYMSTDGVRGGGAYATGRNAEAYTGKAEREQLRSAGFDEAVWQHTLKAFDDIVGSGKFLE